MRAPASLRARITLGGAGRAGAGGRRGGRAAARRRSERDGRDEVDRDLRDRAARLVGAPRPLRTARPAAGPRGRAAARAAAARSSSWRSATRSSSAAATSPPPARAAGARRPADRVDRRSRRGASLTVSLGLGPGAPAARSPASRPSRSASGARGGSSLLIGLLALALCRARGLGLHVGSPCARSSACATGASRVSGARGPRPAPARGRRPRRGALARARAQRDARAPAGRRPRPTERALAATRRFAADAGHELRTPLTGLRASLDALGRNPDLPAAQRTRSWTRWRPSRTASSTCSRGCRRSPAATRPSASRASDVEVADVVDAAVVAARRRHPAVRFELADGARRRGGRGLAGAALRLLADNLLDERRAARAPRRPACAVALEHGDGHALSARRRRRPRDRGRRARAGCSSPSPAARAPTPRGTGLGLAIVAQQAALHGGTLTLGDAPLGGLRAEVRLPASPQTGS